MPAGAPKHDRSEPPTPDRPAVGRPATPNDAACSIHLAGVAPADDFEQNVDATNEDSEQDLLHQLSSSAIEACRGADMTEPRCYLQVLGFKSPEMETAYSAVHCQTTLTGHKIVALSTSSFCLYRIINLLRGVNALDSTVLTIYFLCSLGAVSVLSSFCCVYFTGQAVKRRQELSIMSTGICALALSGWLAQYVDILHYQTDQDVVNVFHYAYFVGILSSVGPVFALVMLRIHFLWCTIAHLAMGALIVSATDYLTEKFMASYIVIPLAQVPERLPLRGCY